MRCHVIRSSRYLLSPLVLTPLCLTLTACTPPVAAHELAKPPAITTITLGPEILPQQVKRLGINLSGQSFYDSGQMLRNLVFRNPGFEGETWQSILRCKSVTRHHLHRRTPVRRLARRLPHRRTL